MYSFIIAVGDNNEMGLRGALPWHLPKEVRYFRSVTEWHTIIMGRRTFDSLPRVLPNRRHIVLTRDRNFTFHHPDVTIVHELEEVGRLIDENEENFVIGGNEIFKLFLPVADRIYLTKVHGRFEADVWFLELNMKEWKVTREWEAELDEKNPIPHTYYVLDKIDKEQKGGMKDE